MLLVLNYCFLPQRKKGLRIKPYNWCVWRLVENEMFVGNAVAVMFRVVFRTLPNSKNVLFSKNSLSLFLQKSLSKSSHPEVFLGKGVLKICSKFTGEHPCWSAISMKLQITLGLGFSPVNLLHIFKTPFLKITSGWLLL